MKDLLTPVAILIMALTLLGALTPGTEAAVDPASGYDHLYKRWSTHFRGQAADWRWVKAVAIVESRENPRALSPAGAQGLLQLMPKTGREMAGKLGIDYQPLNPRANIMLGTAYLAQVERKFSGHPDPLKIKLSLSGYHAGPYRVAGILESVQASGLPGCVVWRGGGFACGHGGLCGRRAQGQGKAGVMRFIKGVIIGLLLLIAGICLGLMWSGFDRPRPEGPLAQGLIVMGGIHEKDCIRSAVPGHRFCRRSLEHVPHDQGPTGQAGQGYLRFDKGSGA